MYLASLMKLSTCFTGIRISVNVAAAAIACAVKLWQMGSRNPVEILEGSSDCRLSLTVYCTQPVVWCQSEPCLGEHFSLQEGLNENIVQFSGFGSSSCTLNLSTCGIILRLDCSE